MLLDTTTKSLEIYLGAIVTANQPQIVVFLVDHTSTTATPKGFDTETNNTTPITMVGAPDSSVQRQVKTISIYNADTSSVTIYVRLNNNGTYRLIIKTTLAPYETLHYKQETGWFVTDSMGISKTSGSTIVRAAPLIVYPLKDATNITTVTAFVSATCHCYFMGVAPFSGNSIDLLVNVTTGVATITWAEVAIYKGTPKLFAAVTDLVRLGYADVSGTFNTTGIKKVNIPLNINSQPGDNIWVVLGCQATTPFQIRGALADNIQCGLFQTLAQRPSLNPGPIASALAGAAVVPGWVAINFN